MTNNNIPKLRFHEFSDGWEVKKLGKMAEFKAGYAFKSEQMLSEKSNFQLLKMSNVYKNELRLDRNSSYWESINDKEKEFLLKEGDTILTLTGTVGKQDYGYSIQIKENNKYLLNQRLVLLREIQNVSCNDFISQLISNEKFLFYFFGEAKGGTGNQTNVGTEDVKNIQLFFPTLPEQQKIATFLSTVDEKLQALKKKKSLLETYKKGVMQKLFSQEIRFKDHGDTDFPKWDIIKLADVCKIARSGGTPTSTNKSYYNGTIPFLSISDMTSQGKYLTQTSNHISKLGLENSSSWIVPKDSLIYSMYASVGFVAINKIPLATSQAVLNLILEDEINLEFMYYTLVDFQKNIAQFITTGTQGNLNAQSVKNFELQIPSIKEQTKIANFLTAIDEKINKVDSQIKQTELWKKGLLQGMFC